MKLTKEETNMADYKEMYIKLAVEISNAIEMLEDTAASLIKVQQYCEDIYVETDDEPILIFSNGCENQGV